MSKAKTRKIVTKRFRFTKNGKIKRKFAMTSHLNRKDSSSPRNRKKGQASVTGKFKSKIKKMVN